MWFGGYQPFTLSDYPSCVAAIAFAQGCNFRCRYCHNGSLLEMPESDSRLMKDEDVLARLNSCKGKLEGLVVSGGEPTLQKDLPAFLSQVKQLGLRIKLDTNGSQPEMISALLGKGLLDYVAMDIKAPMKHYTRVCGVPVAINSVARSISLVANSGIAHHFRTTYVEPLMSREDLEIIKSLLPSHSMHVIQPFSSKHALDPLLRQSPPITTKNMDVGLNGHRRG